MAASSASAPSRPPAAATGGAPQQRSLAELGVEEAEIVAGNSRLQDQARPHGTGGHAPGASSGGPRAYPAQDSTFMDGRSPGGGSNGNPPGGAGASAIERTLLAPGGQRGGRPHPEVGAVRDLLDVTESHEALSAGEDSLAGLVLTTMESTEEVRRTCKKVKHLRARLLGLPARITAAEISEEGDIKVTWGLVCETKSVGDWDPHELLHWVESTEGVVRRRSIDQRDRTQHLLAWHRFLELTRAKKAKFWGLGIKTTAATAEQDHRVTLTLISALLWLVRSPEIGGSGASLAEIWRDFLDEAGGQAALIHIQTPERLRALRKQGGGGQGVATLPSITLSTSSATGAPPPSPTSSTGLMWGPRPGQEPTPEQVKETEVGFLNPNWCKNCHKSHAHPTPLCPLPRRADLPCVFCMGQHREMDCPGPGNASRAAFEVKRKFFFQRVESAMPKRQNGKGGGGENGEKAAAAPAGAKGNGVWIDAGMTPPGGGGGGAANGCPQG
mmetsp:Transcript_70998/g.147971  ORF Transcript_70998/g.147971 Transcript_70998/m.147971 type:complete len:499 (-) Transcript_70998:5421-6917(-)